VAIYSLFITVRLRTLPSSTDPASRNLKCIFNIELQDGKKHEKNIYLGESAFITLDIITRILEAFAMSSKFVFAEERMTRFISMNISVIKSG
jgi:hypothetical protein